MFNILLKIGKIILYFIIIVSILLLIFDSDEYKEKTSKRVEKELEEKERECRSKSMYPIRMNCDDLLDATCHVVCLPYPQK